MKWKRLDCNIYFKEIRDHSPGAEGREREGRKVEGRYHSYKQVKNKFQGARQGIRSWARELKTRLGS